MTCDHHARKKWSRPCLDLLSVESGTEGGVSPTFQVHKGSTSTPETDIYNVLAATS